MKKKTKRLVAVNLLQGKYCEHCYNNYSCKDGMKQYSTCRRWTKDFDLKMKSLQFKASQKKLTIKWSRESEVILSSTSGISVEEELIKDCEKEINKALGKI